MTAIYLVLGLAIGSISPVIKNFILLLSVLIGLYIITAYPLSKKSNNMKALIGDTLPTYLFVWFLVFTLVSNIA